MRASRFPRRRIRNRLGALTALTLLALACAPSEAPDELAPGTYLSPMVQLQRLQGEEDHLHVDEVRLREDGLLLQCSYTFGIVDATDAADMRYLSEGLRHTIPDDRRRPGCIHLASDGDEVYTTHRGNIRNPAFLSGWDIGDPRRPRQLAVLQEPGVSYEGIDVAGGHVYVGLRDRGLGVYRRDGDGFTRVGGVAGFTNAWGVKARGDTVFVADGPGGLVTVDASDPTAPTVLGRAPTGGHARGLAVDGDVAYVAAGAAGLVVVDVSDLSAPNVIGRVGTPGAAVRVDVSGDHAFVAAWRDARVYDISTPATPRLVGAARLTVDDDDPDGDRPAATSRVLGIAGRGTDVFVGNWHVLHSYRLHPKRRAPAIRLPETAALTDFGRVEPGRSYTLSFEVTNQGTAPLTLLGNDVAGDAFRVEPTRVRVPAGDSVHLSLTFTPSTDAPARGYLRILTDDPAAPLRTAYLVGNRPGLGVGMQLPETTAVLLDGQPWSSSAIEGKVAMLSYFATF